MKLYHAWIDARRTANLVGAQPRAIVVGIATIFGDLLWLRFASPPGQRVVRATAKSAFRVTEAGFSGTLVDV